jgi:hypothetical protein
VAQLPQNKARGVLPFYLIEAAAICSDAVLILTTSVLSGIVYYLIVFDRVGPIETFLGIGFLSSVNFTAILAARGGDRADNRGQFF